MNGTGLALPVPVPSSNLFAIMATALSLSACGYDCGTERSTVANGTVSDASGAALASAQVIVSDDIGPSVLRLSVGLMGSANSFGAPLRGHVLRARLVADNGDLLGEIPTDTTTLFRDAVLALSTTLSSDDEYERVRSALLSGRAKIILDTSLFGREHIETFLSDAHDLPRNVGTCNPVS